MALFILLDKSMIFQSHVIKLSLPPQGTHTRKCVQNYICEACFFENIYIRMNRKLTGVLYTKALV